MNKLFLLGLLCLLLPGLAFSQKKRKKKKSTVINLAVSFNLYPAIEPYQHTTSFRNFENRFSVRTVNMELPSQRLGIGFGVQIVKNNTLFHEISLTRLSYNESKHTIARELFDSINPGGIEDGTGASQTAFTLGLRYEFGGYFGKKDAAIRFGLSGGIEPSFFASRRRPEGILEFANQARIYNLEVAVIPHLALRLSKKVSLDFKVVPNILLAYHERVEELNPAIARDNRRATRRFASPDINTTFSLLLRYQIKAPKKRRRRS
ncbi:MAG: hypothetical protein AAGD05_06655 [Bacteroidota bacterium]